MKKKCKYCNKTFIALRKNKVFCSRNCKSIYRVKEIKQDPVLYKRFKELDVKRSRKYRFGRSDLSEVFNKFNGCCKFCGVKAEVIHHIDGNGDPRDKKTLNNDIDNLMPLCRACHARLHMEQGDLGLNK
jgi:hypothetical protein